MSKMTALPPRSKVKPADCWDLSSLYPGDRAWNAAFEKWSKQIDGYVKFRGKLGSSAKALADCLNFDREIDRDPTALEPMHLSKPAKTRPTANISG